MRIQLSACYKWHYASYVSLHLLLTSEVEAPSVQCVARLASSCLDSPCPNTLDENMEGYNGRAWESVESGRCPPFDSAGQDSRRVSAHVHRTAAPQFYLQFVQFRCTAFPRCWLETALMQVAFLGVYFPPSKIPMASCHFLLRLLAVKGERVRAHVQSHIASSSHKKRAGG